MVPLTMALGGSPSHRGCALICDQRASSFGRMGELRHGHGEQDSNGEGKGGILRAMGLYYSLLTLIPAHLRNTESQCTTKNIKNQCPVFATPSNTNQFFRQVWSTWGS